VHARIRAPGDRERVPAREDAVESLSQFSFDGPKARLGSPAGKAGSVVLESELDNIHGKR
jgi:hypothetical protein